ncbi:hypothetical protein [Streptomyces sp. bgisy095]|uniref:hypothetical protein n=1 Tax=unclassified Streptomyces TaxID=2593676 RepID=UPI003D74C78C
MEGRLRPAELRQWLVPGPPIKKEKLNPTTEFLNLGGWSGPGGEHCYVSRTSDWMGHPF